MCICHWTVLYVCITNNTLYTEFIRNINTLGVYVRLKFGFSRRTYRVTNYLAGWQMSVVLTNRTYSERLFDTWFKGNDSWSPSKTSNYSPPLLLPSHAPSAMPYFWDNVCFMRRKYCQCIFYIGFSDERKQNKWLVCLADDLKLDLNFFNKINSSKWKNKIFKILKYCKILIELSEICFNRPFRI